MIVGRIIGWIFLLAAVAVFAWDVVAVIISGDLAFTGGDALWTLIGADDPQRQLAPWLWDYLVGPILAVPAALLFLIVGLLFIVIFRRRRPRPPEPAYE